MKKLYLSLVCSLLLGLSSISFADTFQGPAKLHFDISKISSRLTALRFHYSYHYGSVSEENEISLINQHSVDFSSLPAGTFVNYTLLGETTSEEGSDLFTASTGYPASIVIPPKNPLCSLNNITPGEHTVIFSLEPAYTINLPRVQLGDFLECNIN